MLRDDVADRSAGSSPSPAVQPLSPPSCARRLIRPFIQALARHPSFAGELERLRAMRVDGRVPLERAHRSLVDWAHAVGDPALGLKAGELMSAGSGGALDFALHSASSLRTALELAERYLCLYSDGLSISLDIQQRRALLRLEHELNVPRIASDFLLAGCYASWLRPQLAEATDAEVWFSGETPEYAAEYARVFAPLHVRFGKRWDGFVFAADELERPLPGGNPQLHALHCKHLEALRAELPEPINFSARVCELVAGELGSERPTAVGIARELHMSRRTLVRRLKAEGTSFSEQLEVVRRQLALYFVGSSKLPLTEITKSLSFSHVQGFHRAFKRWTGLSPIRYRKHHLATSRERRSESTH